MRRLGVSSRNVLPILRQKNGRNAVTMNRPGIP
jgi:hypothetical protein